MPLFRPSTHWRPSQGAFNSIAGVALATTGLAALAGCSDSQSPQPEQVAQRPAPLVVAKAPHGGTNQGCDHDHDDSEALRVRASARVGWKSQKHAAAGSVELKVLGFNDFHGQLASRTVAGRPAGGAAVLASYLQQAEAGFEGRSLIVHAGDHVGASPPSSALLQDEPAISFLNTLGNRFCTHRHPDHARCNIVGTLGNHEFDEGKDEMLRLLEGGNHATGPFLEDPYRGARYAYVSANVLDQSTGEPLIAPYVIKHLGGVRVGVIGAVLEETPTIVTPTGVQGLDFVDEATAINAAVAELEQRHVNAIIVTIHQGGRQTSFEGETQADGAVTGPIVDIVAELDDAVDLVISGHAHSFTNAILQNQNGTEILVTQAFSASTAYADITLEVDRATGDVSAKSAQIITTWGDQAPGDAPDPVVADIVSRAEALTAPLVNQVVGDAPAEITRTQNDAGESALGNLIADAQRAAMDTDFAFMNPGGIRADLDAGPATWGELFTIQPFGNSLVRMTLTGAQVIELLEQQWLNQSSPRMLQISGLTYTWDDALPDGQKVIEVLTLDGTALDPAAEYTVAVNSFIAAGGDNFTVLPLGTNQVGGPVDLDALIEYIGTLGGTVASTIEGRVQRLN